jgi:hypothetical protein
VTITMSTYATTKTVSTPRVWLAGGLGSAPDPTDYPMVRDNRMRTWRAGDDGRYHSTDGYHQATWTELHERYDLVEVLPELLAAA